MKLTSHVNDVKAIRPGDPLWHIKSNLIVTPRAGFEISENCPADFKAILVTCMLEGWLKPVAYLKGSEATMEYLK
jgi:hypothetical protein